MGSCPQDVFALCLFSANTAHHFPYNGSVTPKGDVGQKMLAQSIVLMPASDRRSGNNVEIRVNGRALKYEGVSPELEVEGSSVNVAEILTKLGCSATVAAPIHQDFDGQTIRLTLERDGVGFLSFPRQNGTAVTAAITLSDGNTTLYCCKPGYVYDPQEVAGELMRCVHPQYLVASGISEFELPLVHELFRCSAGTRRIFVPHYSLLRKSAGHQDGQLEQVLACTDVLQVNEREANVLIGREDEVPFLSEGVEAIIRRVPDNPGPNVIIVTLGGRGAATVVFRNGVPKTFHHDATPILGVVDTTGAGDAFLAGFIHAEASGCSHKQAVAFATTIAAENIKGRGGHYAQVTKNHLKEFLA